MTSYFVNYLNQNLSFFIFCVKSKIIGSIQSEGVWGDRFAPGHNDTYYLLSVPSM